MSSLGSSSFAEQTHSQSLVFKAVAKKIAATLRCGLPGIITKFNPTTQFVSVQLAIAENLISPAGGTIPRAIPRLDDVLLMLPGDSSWCLTFPNIVGSECYVCFADMCINAWSTHGFNSDGMGGYQPQLQEISRRHDLSDGFAILCPRNQKATIPNYSPSAVELRSMDGTTKVAMGNASGIQLKANAPLHIDGIAGTPVAGTTTPTMALPIVLNGVTYYIKLSIAP